MLGSSCVVGGEWEGKRDCEDSDSGGSCWLGDCGGGREVASSKEERNAVREPQTMRLGGKVCWRT